MQRSKQTVAMSMLFVFAFSHQSLLSNLASATVHYPIPPATESHSQKLQNHNTTHLPIFFYHHIRPITNTMSLLAKGLSVTPTSFEDQLNYFKQHNYSTVSLKEFANVLKDGLSIPHTMFAITFDDGYEDLYTYAWPLLKKYGFKATAFIIVNRVGTPDYATWDQLKEMDRSGAIDVQSHTLNHTLLAHITTKQAQSEIEQSKHILEDRLGKSISLFCYPYGDYNAIISKIVEKAGYSLAFTTRGGVWHSNNLRFELTRIRLSTADIKSVLEHKISFYFGQKSP